MRSHRGAALLGACAIHVLLLGASCGARTRPDLTVNGLEVWLDSGVPFVTRTDLASRIAGVVSVSLAYWGGSWSQLEGRSLTLTSDVYVTCGGAGLARGCFDGNLRVSTSDPGVGPLSCLEQTVLVHEIGHAVIGDPDHHDPRWMAFDAVAEGLSGRIGYGATGELPCVVSASVWRHPLDSP